MSAPSHSSAAAPASADWVRWFVVIVGFLALALSFSMRSSMSLVMPSWEAQFGWTRSSISTGAALGLVTMAIMAPFAGALLDKHGPRALLTIGLVLIAVASAMVAATESLWMFFVAIALIGGWGFGITAQHTVSTAVARLFERRRGLAIGLATSGSTAGQLFLMPGLAALHEFVSWRWGFAAIALGCLILAPVAWILLKRAGAAQQATAVKEAVPQSLGARLGFLIRHPVFHCLFWSFFICGFTTAGVIETHLMPYAVACGYPKLTSATAYGVLAAFNLGGMIFSGWLTDRVHRPGWLATIYFGRAVSFVLLLYIANDVTLLFLFAILFGVFDYGTVPVTASLAAQHLGLRIMGLAMGLISSGHAIGAAIGAFLGGWLFDQFAKYDYVWIASIVLAGLAGVLALAISEPRRGGALRPAAA